MRLSVIIVNYNVRYFLEQALLSVRRAMRNIEGEVWVVDNNSVDDSVRMVQEKFPEVHLIANKNNPGFAFANNQAIQKSQGEFVLLLNPDTLVEEDTFDKCLAFMDQHQDAGALGVKLIDGSGKFLPESKRGFPSPWVAFCKTFGLSALFPKSKFFNTYYLGHLPENETNSVDVLAGCFMFIRKAALDQSGMLDEAFFMYGEDIDLSWRIIEAGYKNYYLPETKIIHYKGESTKKGSLNYVRTFYQAMIIFTQKHFSGSKAGLFILMLKGAIWLRAGITLAQNIWRQLWLPLADAVMIYIGLVILKDFWAVYFYKNPHYFKPLVLWFNFPLYISIWLGSVWLSGGYDTRYDLPRLLRGLGVGTLLLMAVYGLLDLDYRPSRAHLLLGALWAVAVTLSLRLIMHFIAYRNFRIGKDHIKNLIIIGSADESERVMQLLKQVGVNKSIIGFVHEEASSSHKPGLSIANQFSLLGELTQLEEIVRIYRIDEVIFCSKDLSARAIMEWMTRLGPHIAYKIVPEHSLSIIGSSSKNEPGELYTIDIQYNIAQTGRRRSKRIFDLLLCLLLLIFIPFWLIFSPKRFDFIFNWIPVLTGNKTWVGYASTTEKLSLPIIKKGVFTPLNSISVHQADDSTIARLNFLYAKNWDIWQDIEAIVGWKR